MPVSALVMVTRAPTIDALLESATLPVRVALVPCPTRISCYWRNFPRVYTTARIFLRSLVQIVQNGVDILCKLVFPFGPHQPSGSLVRVVIRPSQIYRRKTHCKYHEPSDWVFASKRYRGRNRTGASDPALDVYTQALTPAKHAAQGTVLSLVPSSDATAAAFSAASQRPIRS